MFREVVLIRAAMWWDENDNANRPEAVEILSHPDYVGADYEVITNDVDEAILLADRIIPLNPDGTLADSIRVDLTRPRDRCAMNHDPAFKKLRAIVTNYLMDVGIDATVEETRLLTMPCNLH